MSRKALLATGAAVVVLGLAVTLFFWDPFGWRGPRAMDIPEKAKNPGTATTALATAALPPGYDVYGGLSVDGLFKGAHHEKWQREAARMSRGIVRLAIDATQVTGVVVAAKAVKGSPLPFAAVTVIETRQPKKELEAALAEVEGDAANGGGRPDVKERNSTAVLAGDGRIVQGHKAAVADGLARLKGDGAAYDADPDMADLLRWVDRDATAWVVARGTLVTALAMLPAEKLPGPLAKLADIQKGLVALGGTVHVNETSAGRLALRYEDRSGASHAADAAKALVAAAKEMFEPLREKAGDAAKAVDGFLNGLRISTSGKTLVVDWELDVKTLANAAGLRKKERPVRARKRLRPRPEKKAPQVGADPSP